MTRVFVILVLAVWALAMVSSARPHYPPQAKAKGATPLAREHYRLHVMKGHAWAMVKHPRTYRDLVWHRKALRRINRALARVHAQMAPKQPTWAFWRLAQIWLAQKIAPFHSDAWPNCPDPYAGDGGWDDTAHCEARGTFESIGVMAWAVDPPGGYRCALQFAHHWERAYAAELQRRFGVRKVCP